MMVAQNLHLLWGVLRLISLENNPAVSPSNDHLSKSDSFAVWRMITPDYPSKIMLSQVPRQRAVEGPGKSYVQRAGYQVEIRPPFRRLQYGRFGHALCTKTPSRNHDASEVCALDDR